MATRKKVDHLGEKLIPKDAYFGRVGKEAAQDRRHRENLQPKSLFNEH
jgi:aspartate ammonia-lyase